MSRAGGREGGEQQRGRGRVAVVAAARAGLNEPSHSLAALTVEAVVEPSLEHTLQLCDPAPHRPAAPGALPHLAWEGGDPRPPTKHNTPPNSGEKRPGPLQPPSAPVSPSQSHNLRAGRPGRGQPLPASKRGSPGVRPLGRVGQTAQGAQFIFRGAKVQQFYATIFGKADVIRRNVTV